MKHFAQQNACPNYFTKNVAWLLHITSPPNLYGHPTSKLASQEKREY